MVLRRALVLLSKQGGFHVPLAPHVSRSLSVCSLRQLSTARSSDGYTADLPVLQRAYPALQDASSVLKSNSNGFKNFRPRKSHSERTSSSQDSSEGGSGNGNHNNNRGNNNNNNDAFRDTIRQIIGTSLLTGAGLFKFFTKNVDAKVNVAFLDELLCCLLQLLRFLSSVPEGRMLMKSHTSTSRTSCLRVTL